MAEVGHQLSREVEPPHQLEEAAVRARQDSAQLLSQRLATYCKPITLYYIPQYSQSSAQKLQLSGPEQQAPPCEVPQGLKGITLCIPNPLAPYVHIIYICGMIRNTVIWLCV